MSDAPQGEGWWQASDNKWYPPAASGAAPPGAGPGSAGGGAGGLDAVPLPALSSKIMGLLAWAVLVVGLLAAFWIGFVGDGPDDFTDKVSLSLSTLPAWVLGWAVLLVGAVLAGRNER